MTNIKISKTDLAYIAGIIDGEGSICLVQSFAKRTNGRYVYPTVRVCNTDIRLIKWLNKKIPFGAHHSIHFQKSVRRKGVHHLCWAAGDAIAVLKAVLPYLVLKKKQAEIVLKLEEDNLRAIERYGRRFGNHHPIPDSLVKKRLRAFNRVKDLNRRGIIEVIEEPKKGNENAFNQ